MEISYKAKVHSYIISRSTYPTNWFSCSIRVGFTPGYAMCGENGLRDGCRVFCSVLNGEEKSCALNTFVGLFML